MWPEGNPTPAWLAHGIAEIPPFPRSWSINPFLFFLERWEKSGTPKMGGADRQEEGLRCRLGEGESPGLWGPTSTHTQVSKQGEFG